MRSDQSARDDIYGLLLEYGFRMDQGDLAGFAQLFRHGSWVGIEGSDAVLAWLAKHVVLHKGKTHTRHLLSNWRINIDESGTAASAKSYITLFHQRPGSPSIDIISGGLYRDRFECLQGEWVFRTRNIELQLNGDTSGHLNIPAADWAALRRNLGIGPD